MAHFLKLLQISKESDQVVEMEELTGEEADQQLQQECADSEVKSAELDDMSDDLDQASTDAELLSAGAGLVGSEDPKIGAMVTQTSVESLASMINVISARYGIAVKKSPARESLANQRLTPAVRLAIAKEAEQAAKGIGARIVEGIKKFLKMLKDWLESVFASLDKRTKQLEELVKRANKTPGRVSAEEKFETSVFTINEGPGRPEEVATEMGFTAKQIATATELMQKELDNNRIRAEEHDFNPRVIAGYKITITGTEGSKDVEKNPVKVSVPLGDSKMVVSAAEDLIKAIKDAQRGKEGWEAFSRQMWAKMFNGSLAKTGLAFAPRGNNITPEEAEAADKRDVVLYEKGLQVYGGVVKAITSLVHAVATEVVRWGNKTMDAIEAGKV